MGTRRFAVLLLTLAGLYHTAGRSMADPFKRGVIKELCDFTIEGTAVASPQSPRSIASHVPLPGLLLEPTGC